MFYVTNQVADLEEGPVRLDTSPRQSYEGVSNTCLVTTGSHIATNLAVFFPSFSFFVAVSEGGGRSEGGGEEGKGEGGGG